ncbi:phosphoribosylanthranilate isomerase [Aestuariibius sp. 2305UL40-4]|uniref:phosphoribosylanthranilate isomerase n=1 Tax=Aestuariibius violaceus TaxID=3234132 RepID=UPI00345E2904
MTSSDIRVKICGLTDPGDVAAAVGGGAAYIGFVFFPKSPRHVAPSEATLLAAEIPPGVAKVGLFVDPSDDLLDEVLEAVPLDMVQLHGAESPERVTAVSNRTGLPVMKAVGVRDAADLSGIDTYSTVADLLLIDAKPPEGAALPGGNGLAFDWALLSGRRWAVPWMLAGGLTPENAAEAARLTGARQLDVSSGVESAPGKKDPERIRAFLSSVHGVSLP